MALVVYVLLLLGTLQSISAGDDCEDYYDDGEYQWSQSCWRRKFCCGTCERRYCCSETSLQLTEEQQELCPNSKENHWKKRDHEFLSPLVIGSLVLAVIFIVLTTLCCVCPCCCFYKMCRKPRPVVATPTHTTVVTTAQYPQNPIPTQQYPGYQSGNPQPGYGTPAPYGAQPMPSAPHQGPAAYGPPPPYQDVAGPAYPINYSGAAFTPGQQTYPVQPPVHAGYQHQPAPSATAPTSDFNAQPAYNPDYVAPPPVKY